MLETMQTSSKSGIEHVPSAAVQGYLVSDISLNTPAYKATSLPTAGEGSECRLLRRQFGSSLKENLLALDEAIETGTAFTFLAGVGAIMNGKGVCAFAVTGVVLAVISLTGVIDSYAQWPLGVAFGSGAMGFLFDLKESIAALRSGSLPPALRS